jgi:alpha-glucosidase (family GH31 glycosyl hydrolase)
MWRFGFQKESGMIFFTGQRYDGNVSLKVYREITEIPVFAKAGAIIPLDKNPLIKEEIPSEIIWKIFPGADGEYTLLEDDNETKAKFVEGIFTITSNKKRCVSILLFMVARRLYLVK